MNKLLELIATQLGFVRHNHGYSFIELLIVISMVSILSIVSIQGYLRYIRRGQMIAVINVLEAYKTPINIDLIRTNACPSSLRINSTFGSTTNIVAGGSIAMTLPGVSISSLSYNVSTSSTNYPLCRVNATLNSNLGTGMLSLVALFNANNGLYEWRCGFWDNTTASLGTGNVSLTYALSVCNTTNLSTL